MTVLLALGLWAVSSVLLALVWVGYRRFVGTHGLEDFEVPVESAPKPTVRLR